MTHPLVTVALAALIWDLLGIAVVALAIGRSRAPVSPALAIIAWPALVVLWLWWLVRAIGRALVGTLSVAAR